MIKAINLEFSPWSLRKGQLIISEGLSTKIILNIRKFRPTQKFIFIFIQVYTMRVDHTSSRSAQSNLIYNKKKLS